MKTACLVSLRSSIWQGATKLGAFLVMCGWLSIGLACKGALIAYWNFDEGSGTVAHDISGVATPHDGTLAAGGTGSPPAWIPGRFGTALDFNRVDNNNGSRVIVPFQADLRLNDAFTISFWYRPGPNVGTYPGLMRIGSQSATTGTNIGWGFFRSGSGNNVVFKRGNAQPNMFPARLQNRVWYHFVLRHDGGSGNTAYLFGISTNTQTQTWLDATTTSIFEFGRMDQFDDGDLDDVAFWNEALPHERILMIDTVPTQLGLDYSLAEVRALWSIFDAGPGSVGTVKGITWEYTATLPGSTTPGEAYLSGTKWYVVFTPTAGLMANAILLGDVYPGGEGTPGTLLWTGTPQIEPSARFHFDLAGSTTIGGGVNDLVEILGDLNVVGNRIIVNPLEPLATGTYRLFNYSGARSGSFNPEITHNSRYNLSLDESVPGQVNLQVSGTNAALRWNSTTSGAWDLSASNWFNLGTELADRFWQGDTVRFDDSGLYQTNISLALRVYPSAVTVQSDTLDYTLSGAGLGGAGLGIVKDGASTLTFSGPNNFVGPVYLNGGRLKLGHAAALGATNGPTVIASGATLDLAGFVPGTEPVVMEGAGLNATGAVINTGAALVNTGLRGRVTLRGDTALGGLNRWDIYGGGLAGNGYKLTKLGPPEIALSHLGDTGLGEIEVQAGQLTILGSTLMGDPAKPVIVRSNATLAHWACGTNVHNKPVRLEWARLLNNTTGGTDVATNVAAVTLTGTNRFEGVSSLALLGSVSGDGAVLKTGTGTLYLGATNTYTGPTIISTGRVALVGEGTIASSPLIQIGSGARLSVTNRADGTLTLASGQTLSGAGTLDGNLTAGWGSQVAPGLSTGTLSVTGDLNLPGGATLAYELGSATTEGAGVNDLISVGGGLNLAGVNTVKVLPVATLDLVNPYTLISYAGALSGGAENLAVTSDSRMSFAVDTTSTPGKVNLTVTGGGPERLEWVGGEPGAERLWDVKTTPNWLATVPEVFYAGDQVVFNDFATEFTVELVGELYPAHTSVEADQNDYVFTGSGRIRGGGLTKSLGGKLILANTGLNDYPGPTVIHGGTLQVGVGGTEGSLGPNIVTNNGTLLLDRSDNLTFLNTMVGTGTLQKRGTNELRLGASMANFAGAIVIENGLLRPTTTNALGTSAGGTFIRSGATLDVNGLVLHDEPITVEGAGMDGAGAIINLGAGQNNALRYVTLNGDTTVGGTGRFDIRNPGAGASLTANGFTLTKLGANQFSLVSLGDTGLGDVQVRQGTLSVEGTTGLGLPSGTVSVEAGATLMFWGSTPVHDKKLALNGGARLFKDNGTATIVGTISLNGSNAIESASNAGTDLTLGGVISGSGLLHKLGAGNLFLTADNTYTGGTLISAGALFLGNGGSAGSVLGPITDNGILVVYRSDPVTLANAVSGLGSLNVRTPVGLTIGSAAAIDLAGNLNVGQDSYGRLVLLPGANVRVGSLYVGNPGNIAGDVIQLGGDVVVTNQMRVGHWPNEVSGYLVGGGTLTLTATPAGVVNQSGVAEQAGILYLGIDGIGVFTQTGGVASVHGVVLDARGDTAAINGTNETFNLEGGRFIVGPSGFKVGSLDANRTYTINLGGGTLSSSANWTSVVNMTLTGINGERIFELAGTVRLSGVLSGPGGLVKEGPGTLILTGTNTYSGGTWINDGTLSGNGVIAGPVEVTAGGTLAPGLSIGTLTINNTLLLQGTVLMEVNKTGGALSADLVAGVTTLSYGGTLTVVATGEPLAVGDTIKLFDAAAYEGAFDVLNLPTLPPGLFWDASRLGVDGSLQVVSRPAFSPVSLVDGNLVVSGFGGTPGGSWRLLASDDVTAPLSTWVQVAAGRFNDSGAFTTSIPIDPDARARFFVIVVP
jgi:autotransporter-associated beta strand protein